MQNKTSNLYPVYREVKLGRHTLYIGIGAEAVEAATINGNLIFCVSCQGKAHLTITQCDIGIRNWAAARQGCPLPLAITRLNIEPYLQGHVPVAMNELLRVGDMKGDYNISGIVIGINVK